MELLDAMRTTGAVRAFTDESVSEATISAILDAARFAPSGGNRQSWHVIVIRDPSIRRTIRDIYLDAWHVYVAHVLAGVVPFSPVATPADRAAALSRYDDAVRASRPDGFPETLDAVPVMLVVCADLSLLAATDRDLERYQFIGGASVYPFVWNILLAAREFDLGGVMTTVATRNEPALLSALRIPDTHAVAAVVALGYPRQRLTKLTRQPVAAFTTVDAFDGPALSEVAE
ncbi:MAG: nitroreductase family protein [Actinomycetales bacterium]|nr:nitroreductase family protein [Actinomycetales bacterium]